MVLLAFYPQLSFWASKGSDWQGAYFVSNFDEVAYSAYVQALINGKPRKYDPYLAAETEHESFYSIQFIPAYSIALPAKLAGISSSTAFILLTLVSSALSAIFIFWLLYGVTRDGLISAAGVFIVCCLGAAVAYQGELRAWMDGNILVDFMPFLRRYQPGFAFPFFFAFCGAVWRSLTAESRRSAVVYSSISGLVFGLLVFSYFYLWTAAAAWLACVYAISFLWGDIERETLWLNVKIVAVFALACLIPYFAMVADRSPNIDAVQLLANTRALDIDSPTMIAGIVVGAVLLILIWTGRMKLGSPEVIFALAFSFTPVLLFNQQIVTGRSLQPVHYELFIANYIVLAGFAIVLALLYNSASSPTSRIAFRTVGMTVGLVAVAWGVWEAFSSSNRNLEFADLRDTSIPAIRYIQEREQQTARMDNSSAVVLATNTGTSDMIPTVASLRPLWSSHSSSVGGLNIAENKRLFHHYLALSGFTEKDVNDALRSSAFEMTAALFGSERALPSLGQQRDPITEAEIESEVRSYREFVENFSRNSATNPELSYVIVPAQGEPDLRTLDRWYQRDEGTVTGAYRVYNVTLRP
jgi:hypothetical protein